jgi:TonB family protein
MTVFILLLKVSVLFSLALCCLPLMRRSTAALRHLVCALALSGALVFPLALAIAPRAIQLHLPIVFITSAATVASAAPRNFPLFTILGALWAFGTIALLARLALGFVRMSQIVRTAERTSDLNPVFLANVSTPLICGLFRTAIMLPRSSLSWPFGQRTAALRHELAHMERKDLWTSLIAHIACAVYWFHPLAWALAKQLREEQEAACDDAVLSTGFEPATYAEALVATAQQLTSTSLIGCHMLTRQTLKSRIARLLDLSLPRTSSTAALGRTTLVAVALLAAIGLIYAEPPQAPVQEGRDGKVFKVGGGVTAPRLLYKVDPEYPDDARDAKIEGSVLLSVVVGVDGVAHDINIVTTPETSLGLKAVEAVQQWKFQPGMKDGEAVAVQARIEVNFKLK